MKNITIYICILFSYITTYAQDAPEIFTTESCESGYTGNIEVEFNHDLEIYPLPYKASYYNTTEGDYEDIVITSSFFTIDGVNAGEYEIKVWIDDETIMEFCADVASYKVDIQFIKSSDCGEGGSIEVVALNGVEDYTFEWSDDATINSSFRDDLGSNLYTVKVVDANNCESMASTYLKTGQDFDPETIPVTYVNPNCNDANGYIEFNNPGNYGIVEFLWNTGSTDYSLDNLEAGEYTVSLWNEDGCSHELSFNLIDIGAPVITQETVEYSCGNSNIGVIGVFAESVEGNNLAYQWNNGSTEIIIQDLPVGEYCVTITDIGNNCFVSECYIVEELPQDLIIEELLANNCSSSADAPTGSISLTPIGGKQPYSYSWSNGANESNIKNLSEGNYSVTVTDECGVQTIEEYTITNYKVELELSTELYQGKTTITATPSYGDEPFSYEWSTSESSASIIVTENGEYSVTVTDNNGCYSIENIVIDVVCPNLSVELVPSIFTASCNFASSIQFDNQVSGTFPFQLVITLNGEVVENAILDSPGELIYYQYYNENTSGEYEVTITDNCGNIFNESVSSCLTCSYESIEDENNPYVSLFKNYVKLSQECPCDNDCGILGLTTDKVELEVDESGMLNDPTLPFGIFQIKIIWPEGEANISKTSSSSNGGPNEEKIKIEGEEEYKLSDDDFESGSINVTVQFIWEGEVECEVTIPFSFGELGWNGYFSVLDLPSGTFNPFPSYGNSFNVGTKACYNKCEGVALGQEYTPYSMFSDADPFDEYSCPSGVVNKGYCLFDGMDVYNVNLNLKVLVEYCQGSYYDPPVDTDGDGLPDDVDPCPLDDDVFCDPDDDDDNDDTAGPGGTGGSGGCKTSFNPETCQLSTFCFGEEPVIQEGVISEQHFSGIEPCVYCFNAMVCNVTDANSGQSYSGLVGSINSNDVQIATSYNESNNCDDLCTITFLCEGAPIGWKCGGEDCSTSSWDICNFSQLEDIIEASINQEDGSIIYVRNEIIDNRGEFNIFPNPSNGSFTLDIYSDIKDSYEMMIYAIDGKVIHNELLAVDKGLNLFSINELNLEEGIYLISLISNSKLQTIRHVVQK